MQTVVRTHQGTVRGSVIDKVVAFKGIPYAAPPFGPNRFQPPRPAELWDGVDRSPFAHKTATQSVCSALRGDTASYSRSLWFIFIWRIMFFADHVT